jgi:hypothetical protein
MNEVEECQNEQLHKTAEQTENSHRQGQKGQSNVMRSRNFKEQDIKI